jgi:hypothetical protein
VKDAPTIGISAAVVSMNNTRSVFALLVFIMISPKGIHY